MDTRWADIAYRLGMEAAQEGPERRRRWAGQNEWDAEHMRTESTRFTADQDEELRRCCREAGVTRYTLISYLLQVWMAAWRSSAGPDGACSCREWGPPAPGGHR